MDVRSGDTTSLGAKRVEMEKAEPVKQKPQGSTQDQIATETAAESNGHVSRPRPPRDPRGKKKRRLPPGETPAATTERPPADSSPEPTADKRHVLDVKV